MLLGVCVRDTPATRKTREAGTREKLEREATKLEEWLKEHKTTHRLAYSAIMGKWHCEQCWQSGSTVWNVNREHKGYNKDFIKLATTACEWHAALEGIT